MDLVSKAEEIMQDSTKGKMLLMDYEREPICYIDANSNIYVRPRYQGTHFRGYNLILIDDMGDETIIENYDDAEDGTSGHILASNVLESIREGFNYEVECYVVPGN